MKRAMLLLTAALAGLMLFVPRALALRGYDAQLGYEYVVLGSCPQESGGGEAPILWRVLEATENEAYLYSEYVLFNHRVHEDDQEYVAFGGQWNQTELFSLLNEEKLGEWFTGQERALLLEDAELGTLFLASGEDLHNRDYGFSTDRQRQGYGTPYALENGLFRYSNGSSPYWTRSQSSTKAYGTRCTKVDGRTGYIRCVVMNEGVRPAVRLNLKGLSPVGGDGTLEAPYQFLKGIE